jgi:hypothetical protein
MPIYRFSLLKHYGDGREEVGCLALSDDDDAKAFGRAIIRDLLRDAPTPYARWTMYVAEGARLIGSLSIPPASEARSPTCIFQRTER